MSNYDYSSTYLLLIPSSDQLHILAEINEDGEATFPKVVTNDHVPSWSSHTAKAAECIASAVNCDVYLRRALWQRTICDDDVIEREEALIVVDCIEGEGDRTGLWKPPNVSHQGQWLSEKEALHSRWASIHDSLDIGATLLLYFGEIAGRLPIPRQRQPWRLFGWFVQTVQIVDTLLASHQLLCVSKLEQSRNAFQSTILTCEVHDKKRGVSDVIFVKCTVGVFREAQVTKVISQCLPFIIPNFIGNSSDLFLQWRAADVGGVYGTPSDKAFLQALAHMQLNSLANIDTLKIHVPVRGPLWLSTQVSSIFDRQCIALHDPEDVAALKSRSADIQRYCSILAGLNIPLTLVHRDLDLSNVFAGATESDPGANVRFIDWASCCITHPFIDFVRITRTLGLDSVQDEDAKSNYLHVWLKFGATMKEVNYAVSIALPLMMFHMLIDICDLWEQATEGHDKEKLSLVISSSFSRVREALDEIKDR